MRVRVYLSIYIAPTRLLGEGGVGITKSENLSISLKRSRPGLKASLFLTLADVLTLPSYSALKTPVTMLM